MFIVTKKIKVDTILFDPLDYLPCFFTVQWFAVGLSSYFDILRLVLALECFFKKGRCLRENTYNICLSCLTIKKYSYIQSIESMWILGKTFYPEKVSFNTRRMLNFKSHLGVLWNCTWILKKSVQNSEHVHVLYLCILLQTFKMLIKKWWLLP